MAERKSFQLNTEPHVAEIGEDTFLFHPEVYGDELLDSWAELRAKTLAARSDTPGDDATKIAERSKSLAAASKAFLGGLMLDDDELVAAIAKDPELEGAAGATRFAEVKLPDRVMLELQRWILEVYGLRPTGASSGSSEPSPTLESGDDSTGTSPTAAPTP